MFKNDYMLGKVSIRGEVGNCTYQASGHVYFSLKDENANIQCVLWASKRSALGFKLETGMQIVCTGSVEVYEVAGRYQLICSKVEHDGIGDIYERFEALKKKLKEQGMFDDEYKRPIPKHIKTLGVVTAPTGAAVRDIINISKRRNPGIQIVLFPSLVQGPDAPPQIIKGIRALEDYGVDCIIVGRGGGSMEDLWCFNDEGVAHAIFNCTVPVISAVGHETDYTIADFVSDLRAPTPSAAAELAVFDVHIPLENLEDYRLRLNRLMRGRISNQRTHLANYRDKLRLASPQSKLNLQRNRLGTYDQRLHDLMERVLVAYKNRLSLTAGKLNGLSPLNKLGGGYAYVSSEGKAVKSVSDVAVGGNLTVNLTDGTAKATVTEITEETVINE